jgi:hypothetical protein
MAYALAMPAFRTCLAPQWMQDRAGVPFRQRSPLSKVSALAAAFSQAGGMSVHH